MICNYNGGGTDLGAVIARVSGKALEVFAGEAFFQPLGITDWEWQHYENSRVSAAAGLRLRLRDAAKIRATRLSGRRLERDSDRLGGVNCAGDHSALSSRWIFRRPILLWLSVVVGVRARRRTRCEVGLCHGPRWSKDLCRPEI